MKTAHIVVFVVAAAVLAYMYAYAMSSPYRITAAEARQRIRDKQFDAVVDVRTDVERATLGYYPGSVHLKSTAEVERRFPDTTTRILIYCNTGQRARTAATALQERGYTNVRYIASSHLSLMD